MKRLPRQKTLRALSTYARTHTHTHLTASQSREESATSAEEEGVSSREKACASFTSSTVSVGGLIRRNAESEPACGGDSVKVRFEDGK